MPVFGIVPYRTEARTRSEARIQTEVDRLLQVLSIVGNVIRTALTTDRQLLDAFPNMIHPILRPPPITLLEGMPNTEYRPYAYGNRRAMDRGYAYSLHPAFASDWLWGDMLLGKEWLRTFPVTRGTGDDGWTLPNWGTIQ